MLFEDDEVNLFENFPNLIGKFTSGMVLKEKVNIEIQNQTHKIFMIYAMCEFFYALLARVYKLVIFSL